MKPMEKVLRFGSRNDYLNNLVMQGLRTKEQQSYKKFKKFFVQNEFFLSQLKQKNKQSRRIAAKVKTESPRLYSLNLP